MAREYTSPVQVVSQGELYDMFDAGELTEGELTLLVALFERPLNLNRADRLTLFDLPEITWAQVDAIIAHRGATGGFTQVDDLLRVAELPTELVEAIRPFVTTVTVPSTPDEPPLVRGKAESSVVFEAGLGDDRRSIPTPSKLPSGYVTTEVEGLEAYSAGVELLWRPMVSPRWDRSSGFLVSPPASSCPDQSARYPCTPEVLRLQGAYAAWESGIWRVIAGTFHVGFGQRLILDTTHRDFPNGWERRFTRTVDRDDGSIRPNKNLRGAAVSVENVDTPIGWLDATAFVSYQSHDLFRSDYWVAGDELYGALACTRDSECPDGYSCRPNGQCYTSRILELDPTTGRATPRSFAFPTTADAFSELMGGGNVTLNFDERSSVGVTAYRSHVSFNLPEEANARFAPGASYPRRPDFGAVGIDGKVGIGPVDIFGEIGLTHRGAAAAVARVRATPLGWLDVDTTLRWYSRDFDNPHSRSYAAPTLTLGSRRRNEIGGLVNVVVRPLPTLKLVTTADFWVRPQQFGWSGSPGAGRSLTWFDDATTYLRLTQRGTYRITSKEYLGLQVDYGNNDLSENGRSDRCTNRAVLAGFNDARATDCGAYSGGGLSDLAGENDESELLAGAQGRGEKIRLQANLTTTRLFGVRIAAKYVVAWLDAPGEQYDDRLAFEHYGRVSVASALWEGARLWGAVKVWPEQGPTNGDDTMICYVGVAQVMFEGLLAAQVAYGLVGNQRRAGFDLRQFGEVRLGSHF